MMDRLGSVLSDLWDKNWLVRGPFIAFMLLKILDAQFGITERLQLEFVHAILVNWQVLLTAFYAWVGSVIALVAPNYPSPAGAFADIGLLLASFAAYNSLLLRDVASQQRLPFFTASVGLGGAVTFALSGFYAPENVERLATYPEWLLPLAMFLSFVGAAVLSRTAMFERYWLFRALLMLVISGTIGCGPLFPNRMDVEYLPILPAIMSCALALVIAGVFAAGIALPKEVLARIGGFKLSFLVSATVVSTLLGLFFLEALYHVPAIEAFMVDFVERARTT